MKLRFNQLPKKHILNFLNTIVEKENVKVSKNSIENVQAMFKCDIRSMINYIQLNQQNLKKDNILDNDKWDEILDKLIKNSVTESMEYIIHISNHYDIEEKNIINELINYIIHNKIENINEKFLNMIEFIMHDTEISSEYYINYSLLALRELTIVVVIFHS